MSRNGCQACPGTKHLSRPSTSCLLRKTWMPGTWPGMTTESSTLVSTLAVARSLAAIAHHDLRHLAALLDLREAVNDNAFQGQVALPQTKHHRIARQFLRCPLGAEAFARCDLVSEQHLGHAKVGAALTQCA